MNYLLLIYGARRKPYHRIRAPPRRCHAAYNVFTEGHREERCAAGRRCARGGGDGDDRAGPRR